MENLNGNLEQIINETIRQTIATNTFDFNLFIQRMENEFVRLGFRDNPQEGGYRTYSSRAS